MVLHEAIYEKLFKGYLTRIKKYSPWIISDKINQESDMILWRSGRRGYKYEVINQSLDQLTIYMKNMWRKRKCAKGMDTIMGLREHYTQA